MCLRQRVFFLHFPLIFLDWHNCNNGCNTHTQTQRCSLSVPSYLSFVPHPLPLSLSVHVESLAQRERESGCSNDGDSRVSGGREKERKRDSRVISMRKGNLCDSESLREKKGGKRHSLSHSSLSAHDTTPHTTHADDVCNRCQRVHRRQIANIKSLSTRERERERETGRQREGVW